MMASGILSYHRPASKALLLQGIVPAWIKSRKAYQIAAVLSCPPWVDRAALRAIDAKAKEMTLRTGIPHVVDHIIPLNHPKVHGLTVPENLRVITAFENGRKGGKWSDAESEQLALFPLLPVEQYCLAL